MSHDDPKLTPENRSKIRAQVLSMIEDFGFRSDEWTCLIEYGFYSITASAYLKHKKLGVSMAVHSIYFDHAGNILQADHPTF